MNILNIVLISIPTNIINLVLIIHIISVNIINIPTLNQTVT